MKPEAPGHESGHVVATSSPFTWKTYLDGLLASFGGWTALADELIRRADGAVEIGQDVQSIEKGLRRLSRRQNDNGGQYGRWLLRFFGLPPDVEAWLRWLAQYHTRFADLPTSLKLQQLQLWERPPISESRLGCWLHIGFASVYQRLQDLDACVRRLALAKGGVGGGSAAELEAALLEARLLTDAGDRTTASALFDNAEALLAREDLTREDRLCYAARLAGQRAFHLTKPVDGQAPKLREAKIIFERVEEDERLPFVSYRKFAGLAYCTWRLGDVEQGVRLAKMAGDYAADGGLVRFRVMTFNLLSKMLPPEEAADARRKARALAQLLEDEDLLARVARLEARADST